MKRLTQLGFLAVAAVIGCAVQGEASAAVIDISTAPGEVTTFVPAASRITSASTVLIRFRNESTQAHNLVFLGDLEAATRTIVEPGTTDEIVVAVPGPGTYLFVCTIHESMEGSLTIAAPAAVR